MKCQLLLIVVVFCLNSYSEARRIPTHHIQESKRALGDGTAAAPAESPESLLMRLKLLTYTEKLKAKEAKKKAKADKKAAKDAAFAAYLGSFLPPTVPAAGAAPAPAAAPVSPLAALLAPAAAPAPAAPLLPMIPVTTAAPATDDDENEDETINEIVKRYAPALRKQFYGSDYPAAKHYNDNEENNSERDEDSDEDSQSPNSRSGSYSKFGTGPAGSPNGVGYDDGKINQAGCSGSHIHICSGTTVYLRNPDDDSTGQLGEAIEMGADDEEGTAPDNNEEAEQDESEEKSKHKKKHHH